MPQTGKTWKMLQMALEMAGEHEMVLILSPSKQHTEYMRKLAWNLLSGQFTNDGPSRFEKLKFVHSGVELLGYPQRPLLADHKWVEDMLWVERALSNIRVTLQEKDLKRDPRI